MACGDANSTFGFIVFLRKTTSFWYKYEWFYGINTLLMVKQCGIPPAGFVQINGGNDGVRHRFYRYSTPLSGRLFRILSCLIVV